MTEEKNRRATFRKNAILPLSVASVTDRLGKPKDVAGARFVSLNLSEGGLAFETAFAVEIGDVVALALPLQGELIQTEAIVKNVTKDWRGERNLRRAGVEFFRIGVADRRKIAIYVKEATFVI